MIRTLTILAVVLTILPSTLSGQIPPGAPYDARKHANPIITFVESKDFKTATYEEAQKAADIPLLGFSKEEGTRQNVELADAGLKKIDFMRRLTAVNFYPVVRQTFRLVSGQDLILHSFRAPKAPREMIMAVYEDALSPSKRQKVADQRLGSAPKPEEVEVRGKRGLLFEMDKTTLIVWQEDGVMHTASCDVSRKELFRLLDDLL